MTRSEVYRGYRSLTTSVSSMLAILGAVTQPLFVASPDTELGRYLIFWIGIAAVSAIVVGSEVWWRARRTDSEVLQQMTRLAVEQLSPSLVVGALLTLCIFQTAPQVSWMLPGLWALIFSLGIFAPPAATTILVGCFVLRLVWSRLSILGARRQRVITVADGYLFRRWSVDVCGDSVLDVRTDSKPMCFDGSSVKKRTTKWAERQRAWDGFPMKASTA